MLWSAAETDPARALPLLVVHDGPEYARYSSLLRLLDHLVAFGELSPLRAVLLPPPLDRIESYSASARYARALTEEWLPALPRRRAGRPIGLGASLGALALLHAHYAKPDAFGGLLLQSGSFFRQRFDSHESGAPRYVRITRFVSRIAGGQGERRADPGHRHVRHRRGEPGQQPLARRDAGRAGLADASSSSTATRTTGSRGATSLHPHLAELILEVAP